MFDPDSYTDEVRLLLRSFSLVREWSGVVTSILVVEEGQRLVRLKELTVLFFGSVIS